MVAHDFPRNLLVLGGTGFVGSSLCEQLVEHSGGGSARVCVPSRHPQRGKALITLPTLEVVRANVHDDADLAQLVGASDAVVNLIAILHGSPDEFERVHVELPRRIAAACEKAGVRRVVHVSALGASADAPSHYLRSKAAGETVLRSAKLDLTVLRPSVIFGARDHLLNTFARLQALFPVMPLACAGARFQPVWVEDVARALVRCLGDRGTVGKTYECAGTRVYTLRELVHLAGTLAGHARPILALPDWAARLQAAAMSLLPGEPLMSSDNIDSMRVPNVATGMPGLPELGISPAPLDLVAQEYLSPGQGPARMDVWRQFARRR
jgi:NADH dehydrogenase